MAALWRSHYCPRVALVAVLLLCALGIARAGGGPLNVLIVVNSRSRESLEIGNAYRRAREIPYRQLLVLNTSTAFAVPYPTYQNEIENPIRDYLKAQQLEDAITCIVLTRGMPQLVNIQHGVAVASLLATLEMPNRGRGDARLPNPYHLAPTAFTHRQDNLRGMYLVTVLNGYNVEDIRNLIAQGVGADDTAPEGRFIFQANSRTAQQAGTAVELLNQRGLQVEMVNAPPRDSSNLMGYFSGSIFSGLTRQMVTSCGFRPGAIVDLAQNFSAAEQNFDENETPILLPASWFVRAGAAGILGVVGDADMKTMPAGSHQETLFDRYTSGFSLAESFYSALPYLNWQNIILGDPLCAPYAKHPVVVTDITPDPQQGIVPIKVTATAQGRGATISRVALYIDDRFAQTLYEPAPARIILRVADHAVTYTLPRGASLRTLLEGLSDAVNASAEMKGQDGVQATPSLTTGVVRLTARLAGAASNNRPVSIEVESDQPGDTTVSARLERGWLAGGGADPTCAHGTVTFIGRHIHAGDEVTLQIQQERISYVVPEENATLSAILDGLIARIGASKRLRQANGVRAFRDPDGMPFLTLEARAPGERGNLITYQLTVKPMEGSRLKGYPDTSTQLTGGHDGSRAGVDINFSLGNATIHATHFLKTTELSDGYHRLQVVAYDSSPAQVQGSQRLTFQVRNAEAPPIVTLPEKLGPVSGEVTVPVTVNEHVTRVELYVDGQRLGSADAAPFSIRLPLANLGRGTHDLWATGYDADGKSYLSLPTPLDVTTPPDIFRVVPGYATLAGGTIHRIVGAGFQPNCTVWLAGTATRAVTQLSSTLLEVTSAPGTAARGSVVVTNPDGLSATLPDAFKYYLPHIAHTRIVPEHDVIAPGLTAQFAVRCLDQFDQPIPAALSWDIIGVGAISPTGKFTAPPQGAMTLLRAVKEDGKEAARATVMIGLADVPDDGRLRQWLLLGPFPDPDATGLLNPLIPEATILPSHEDAIGALRWQSLYAPNSYLDLTAALTPNTNVVAYAHLYIFAPAATPCALVFGATDGIRIRLNGELLYTLRTQRAKADPNQMTLPITLQAGWNRLLVKLDQDALGSWGCYLRLLAPDGKPLNGLTFALDKPADLTLPAEDAPAKTP